MRKIFLILLLLVFMGCTTAAIPSYLPDKKPYQNRFYADFDTTLNAVTETLKELGWETERTTNPLVYEQNQAEASGQKQVLIITGIRQTPMFLGTRYARMNIFLRANDNISDIEVRYLTLTALPFKTFKIYNNNSVIERIFSCMEKHLKAAK